MLINGWIKWQIEIKTHTEQGDRTWKKDVF